VFRYGAPLHDKLGTMRRWIEEGNVRVEVSGSKASPSLGCYMKPGGRGSELVSETNGFL